MNKFFVIALITVLLLVAGIGLVFWNAADGLPDPLPQEEVITPQPVNQEQKANIQQEEEVQVKTVNMQSVNDAYRFTMQIPQNLEVEYVANSQAINIFNPAEQGESNLEKSQVFISMFEANTFLTLTTVDILSREQTELHSRPAVRYEIEKKAGVANFPNQPSWRSQKHKLIDIRESASNPSIFYVFAYNPALDQNKFEEMIDSIQFTSSYSIDNPPKP